MRFEMRRFGPIGVAKAPRNRVLTGVLSINNGLLRDTAPPFDCYRVPDIDLVSGRYTCSSATCTRLLSALVDSGTKSSLRSVWCENLGAIA